MILVLIAGNVAIMLQLPGALQTIASQSASPSLCLVLREQALRIAELAGRPLTHRATWQDLSAGWQARSPRTTPSPALQQPPNRQSHEA